MVVIEPLVLDTEFAMNSKELVDFIFEFQSQGDFFVECLFSFLIILVEDLFFIGEVDIFCFQVFDLSKNLEILRFIEFVIFLYNLLPLHDLLPQLFNFHYFLPLDYSHKGLKLALCAILQQNWINLPNIFESLNLPFHHLFQVVVEADTMHE